MAKFLPPDVLLSDDEKISEPEKISTSAQVADKKLPSIDMAAALANCMDSEEFFAEMAEEFVSSDKTAELGAALAAEDFKNYRIAVHALKSTALVIGAVELSEKAKAQEFAARDGKFEELKENHAALMAMYKKVREELGNWLGAK